MGDLEQSQTSNGPCSSADSKSHITPLQIYKAQDKWEYCHPCHGSGAGITVTGTHSGATMEPQMGWVAAKVSLHLCPDCESWGQLKCCT